MPVSPSRRNPWPWALILGWVLFFVMFYYQEELWTQIINFYELAKDPERIRGFLASWGPWAPVIYILFQVLQVVFAPLPGETTGAFIAGFLFGTWQGLLYGLIGLGLGSILAFLLGNILGEKLVRRWLPPEFMQRFDFLMEPQGTLAVFILFALPYFPKDYLCLLLGLSGMSFKLFVVVMLAGRITPTFLFALQGAQVFKGNYYLVLVMLAVLLVMGAVIYIFRKHLYHWIRHLAEAERQKRQEGR